MRRRLRVFFRRLLERMLGRHREGPEPPARLAEQARLFVLIHPGATPEEWEAYAVRLAGAAYREGFVRGLEARALSEEGDVVGIDVAGDRERYEWSLREYADAARALDGEAEGDMLAGVPPHRRAEALATIGELLGTHRVVMVDGRAPSSRA